MQLWSVVKYSFQDIMIIDYDNEYICEVMEW